jgi:ABC-2 type transport system permease protein
MKRYLRIYLLFIRLNYHKAIAHRGDFFSGLFGSLAWGIFSIIAVYVLSARTTSVYGWSRNELYILMGVFNIIVGGVFRMICALNFDKMSRVIQHGELDSYLLKPVSSQFMISFLDIQIYSFLRIGLAIMFTFYIIISAHIAITISGVFTFIILAFFGVITIYSFWFLVMTLLLWLPDLYNLSEILYTADNLTRYPPQILWEIRAVLFYVFLPYTFLVSTPTKALLHKLSTGDLFMLVGFACGLLFISRKFWKFALRYYTSAN